MAEELICYLCGEPLDECCDHYAAVPVCCVCEDTNADEGYGYECDNCGGPVEVEGLCEACAEEEDGENS